MSQFPKKIGSFSNQTVYILLGAAVVLLLLCGGVVLIMIACLLPSATLVTSPPAAPPPKVSGRPAGKVEASMLSPDQVARAFLNELKENKLEDAYARTSPSYQGRVSQNAFNDYLARNTGFLRHTTQRLSGAGQNEQMRRWEGHVGGGPNPGCDFTLEITLENDGWQVNQFIVKK